MGRILSHWKVTASILLSAVLILGAYFLTRSIKSPLLAQASTEAALLQAIATRDSDGDGLYDWEEVLYGTSPSTIDTFSLGMSDGEAVAKGLVVPKAIADVPVAASSESGVPIDPSLPPPPPAGTLTAAFAENFFLSYLQAREAKGGDLSEQELTALTDEILNSLASSIQTAPDFKTAGDLVISGSGVDGLKQFAAAAEAVFLSNTSNSSKSEILYLADAVEKNDTSALEHIASRAKAYRSTAAGLAALSVPRELAADDLMLINALARLSEIMIDFTRVNDDPLAAILALHQYPDAVQKLGTALINFHTIYLNAGVVLKEGEPGASLVNIIPDIVEEQKAGATEK